MANYPLTANNATIHIRFQDNLGVSASTSMNVLLTTGTELTQAQVDNMVADCIAPWSNAIPPSASVGVGSYVLQGRQVTAPPPRMPPFRKVSTAGATTGGAPATLGVAPPNVCAAVQSIAGFGNPGHNYFPFVTNDWIHADGALAPTGIATYEEVMLDAATALRARSWISEVVTLRGADWTHQFQSPIQAFVCAPFVSTQKRRLRRR